MLKKLLITLFVILLIVVVFTVILSFISPEEAEAPVDSTSTFQGPRADDTPGFRGPTEPPPQ